MLIPQPRVCASHPSPHTQHTRFPSKRRWFCRPSLCTHTHTHSHTHTKKKNHNPVGSRLGMSLHATSQRPLDLGQHLCPWVGLQLCPPILLWFLALTPLAKKRIVVACSIHIRYHGTGMAHTKPPKFLCWFHSARVFGGQRYSLSCQCRIPTPLNVRLGQDWLGVLRDTHKEHTQLSSLSLSFNLSPVFPSTEACTGTDTLFR